MESSRCEYTEKVARHSCPASPRLPAHRHPVAATGCLHNELIGEVVHLLFASEPGIDRGDAKIEKNGDDGRRRVESVGEIAGEFGRSEDE